MDTKEESDKALIRKHGRDGKRKVLGVALVNPYCWPVRPSLWKWLKTVCTGNRKMQYDRMYFFSDSAERRAKYQKYLSDMAEGVREYRSKHDAFVVIIGMEQLDAKACVDFQALIGGDSIVVTSKEYDVFQMTSVLHSLDVLVTSRYHAAVLSMLKGSMPVVAVSMDSRLDGLFCEMLLDGKYLHHVDDDDLAMGIARSLDMAEADKELILETIKANVAKNIRVLKDMAEVMEVDFHRTWN